MCIGCCLTLRYFKLYCCFFLLFFVGGCGGVVGWWALQYMCGHAGIYKDG